MRAAAIPGAATNAKAVRIVAAMRLSLISMGKGEPGSMRMGLTL
jgi:hypothetical protein